MVKFNPIIERPEYSFLRTDPHLGSRVQLLTFGGSHAYGTNTKNSDIDLRGVTLEHKSEIIGFETFEQVIEQTTDTTIYGFNKMITLLIDCNPNVIEILGNSPDSYIVLGTVGKIMVENRGMFLSKRAINSFGGYALQQLNRLNNSLARDRMSQAQKEQHILNSLHSSMLSFNSRYQNIAGNTIQLYIDKSQKEAFDTEIFLNMQFGHYPLRDMVGMTNELQSIVKEYNKINHRNKKKDEAHLDKHAMHLMRLYIMAIDILETGRIITYRSKEHDLLMSIRKGKYRHADGNYHDSFFEMKDEYVKRFEYAAKHTNLPDQPNMKVINEFKMYVNEKIVREEI